MNLTEEINNYICDSINLLKSNVAYINKLASVAADKDILINSQKATIDSLNAKVKELSTSKIKLGAASSNSSFKLTSQQAGVISDKLYNAGIIKQAAINETTSKLMGDMGYIFNTLNQLADVAASNANESFGSIVKLSSVNQTNSINSNEKSYLDVSSPSSKSKPKTPEEEANESFLRSIGCWIDK